MAMFGEVVLMVFVFFAFIVSIAAMASDSDGGAAFVMGGALGALATSAVWILALYGNTFQALTP